MLLSFIISKLNGFIVLNLVYSRRAIAREILNRVGIEASYKLIQIKV